MRFYQGATGLKTGTTDGAGSCLSATASRDELSLVAVVMGCPTSNDRFASARGLLDFGFANYKSAAPPKIDDELVPVRVLRGVEDNVTPVCDEPGRYIIEKGQEDLITQEITVVPDIEAPVIKGQVIGKVEVLVNGELAGEYNLRASSDVARMTFPKAFGKLLTAMLRMNRSDTSKEKAGAEDVPKPDKAMPQESAAAEPAEDEPCVCGTDKCYCKDIGDICGCTR